MISVEREIGVNMSVLIDEINARQRWRRAHTVVAARRHRLLCVLEGVSVFVLIGMLLIYRSEAHEALEYVLSLVR